MIQDAVLQDSLGVNVAKQFIRQDSAIRTIGSFRESTESETLDTEVCKELVRRQLISDNLLSKSIFFGFWQIIFWPRKKFFKKGSWPLSCHNKFFNFWVIGPFEIRHYLKPR